MAEPTLRLAAVAFAVAVLSACDRDSSAASPTASTTAAQARASSEPKPKPKAAPSAAPLAEDHDESYRFEATGRIVAIGDVHGDLSAARAALRLGGAIGDGDRWTGGKLTVVQTGDQLDRGDDEKEILELFDVLADQAEQAGGRFVILNGNHETMNVMGDFRYVTPGGFEAFAGIEPSPKQRAAVARMPAIARGRAAAFLPGGPYARRLSRRKVIAMVGDSVFVHGGVLPEHVEYGIGRLNRETSRWMRGDGPMPEAIADPQAPVWTRRYSRPGGADCAALGRVLGALHATRMVVGHTPQKDGITSACDDRVWRIDVGMASHYGGEPAVLEISGGEVREVREK